MLIEWKDAYWLNELDWMTDPISIMRNAHKFETNVRIIHGTSSFIMGNKVFDRVNQVYFRYAILSIKSTFVLTELTSHGGGALR